MLGDGETGQDFAAGLLGEYQADVAAGTFALVDIDFATPTETFPVACTGLATYDALSELVEDVTEACSFDAWLEAKIEEVAGDSLAAHQAELDRLKAEEETAQTAQVDLIAQLYTSFDIQDQSLADFTSFLKGEF